MDEAYKPVLAGQTPQLDAGPGDKSVLSHPRKDRSGRVQVLHNADSDVSSNSAWNISQFKSANQKLKPAAPSDHTMSDTNVASPTPQPSAFEKLIQASKKIIYEGRNNQRASSQQPKTQPRH